jgi:two-component system CheB/CheR fusion protein
VSSDEANGADLEELLQLIRSSRGFDFTGYKRTTLSRRIKSRMEHVNVASYAEYGDLLEADVDEFGALFDTILINVTAFFRDKPAWDYVARAVVPELVEQKGGEPIRVWCAGCATGEEAYTIAILLAEALGPEPPRMVKIYATDVDNHALTRARQGAYSMKQVADVPAELRSKYFDQSGDTFVFRSGLRQAVIFGRHDLAMDPPIGRLDLLVCRNTLMYFNSDVQGRIVNRFRFALEPHGYLFLGKAEMLLSYSRLFTPVSMKNRVFRKSGISFPRELSIGVRALDLGEENSRIARSILVRDLLIDAAPVALVAVDFEGHLVAANSEARGMFGLTSNDFGMPLERVELSQRPLDLRARLEQAYSERRTVVVRGLERVFPDGHLQYLDVEVKPLVGPEESLVGAAVSFLDVTSNHRLRFDLQRSREDLETTYEELRSSNEELETTNEELRTRVAEIDILNERFQSLLGSIQSAVVALDRELLVEVWNHQAEELWGLRAGEVEGKPLATLDSGLPAEELQNVIRSCLDGASEREVIEVDGVTRRGRPTRFHVVCTPVAGSSPPTGVVLVVEAVEE